MIVRTLSGDVERRAAEWGSSAIPPYRMSESASTSSGQRVTPSTASGLPAVGRAIRLVSMLTAAAPLRVYRKVDGLDVPADDTWQWDLFEQPTIEASGFDWQCDLASCIEGYGNFLAQKVKARVKGQMRVVDLPIVDPETARIRRDNGSTYYDVKAADGHQQKGLSSADVLHVRGFAWRGLSSGLSPIMWHAASIGWSLALEEFAGSYWRNGGIPPIVLNVPGSPNSRLARRTLALWNLSQQGTRNAGRTGITFGGTKVETVGLGLRDQQFVELFAHTIEDVARIMDMPQELLEGGNEEGKRLLNEQLALRFYTFSFFPRLRRIEDRLACDPDLFPPGCGLRPKFDTAELLRADAKTETLIEHTQIQDGSLLVDEARLKRGQGPLPPIPTPEEAAERPGMVPQVTPVGGEGTDLKNDPAGDALAASDIADGKKDG